MQLIEIQRPLPEVELREYKYKLLSEGWSYKVVTRVAKHFASEIESEKEFVHYAGKTGDKWNHPFIKGGVGACKCWICGERLCKHFRTANGRRALTVEAEDVNNRGRMFKSEFSEKNCIRIKQDKVRREYNVVVEKECLICGTSIEPHRKDNLRKILKQTGKIYWGPPIITMDQCKHTICVSCLKEVLQSQIEFGTFPLKCPDVMCETELNILKLIPLIKGYSHSLIETLWEYHCKKLTTVNSHQYMRCVSKYCNGYMSITAEDDRNNNSNSVRDDPLSEEPLINEQNDLLIELWRAQPPKFIPCVSLVLSEPYIIHGLHSVCYHCRMDHNANTTCEEHIAHTLTELRVTACPRCGDRYHLDNSRCNYFKCPSCKFEFCGQCMQKLTYDHYFFESDTNRCEKKTRGFRRRKCCNHIIFWVVFILVCLCFPVTLILFLKEYVLKDQFRVRLNFVTRRVYVKYRILKAMTDILLILVYNIRAYIFVIPIIVGSPLAIIYLVTSHYL